MVLIPLALLPCESSVKAKQPKICEFSMRDHDSLIPGLFPFTDPLLQSDTEIVSFPGPALSPGHTCGAVGVESTALILGT